MLRLAALLLIAGCAWAQSKLTDHTITMDPGNSPPKATIGDVAWLAGAWQGPGLTGLADEIWSAPAAGSMVGAFRQLKGDSVWFYEIMSIAEHEGSLVFRLKHFNSDLKGWEEKNEVREFKLVKLDAKGAWFDGLSVLRDGPNGMIAAVAIKSKDGSVSEGKFVYRRPGVQPKARPQSKAAPRRRR